MCLSCTMFDLKRVICWKLPILTYPTCICRPIGVIPFEFCHDLSFQKTRAPGLSCGITCKILSLAILIQCQRVTNKLTDTWRWHIPCQHSITQWKSQTAAQQLTNFDDIWHGNAHLLYRPTAGHIYFKL